MRKLSVLGWIAMILLVIGGLNWGFLGLFGVNIIGAIFGELTVITRIIYVLVGLSAVYAIFLPSMSREGEMMHHGEPMKGSV